MFPLASVLLAGLKITVDMAQISRIEQQNWEKLQIFGSMGFFLSFSLLYILNA